MRRSGPVDADDRSSRWKRCRRKVTPSDVHIKPPYVEDKLAFPRGVHVEKVNGFRQEAGTMRLRAGWPVYLDGSAEAPGTRHATASASLVQMGPEGEMRTVQLALDNSCPRSAVAGEMAAFAMLLEILARGFVDDADGSVEVHVDCKAVLDSYNAEARHISERFLFGGWWRELCRPAVAGRNAEVI